MSVSAIIVTRGDQPLLEIMAALPHGYGWELLVWDNGAGALTRYDLVQGMSIATTRIAIEPAVGVYGRYAAIPYAKHEVIYVQDDDVVVSDPYTLVGRWYEALGNEWDKSAPGVVCNMPEEFRHDFYEDHALVGFGAIFHRHAPETAFALYDRYFHHDADRDWFRRTCDVVFTCLTDRLLVDVPKRNLPWAYYETRMWKQAAHQAERSTMLARVKAIRAKEE